LSDSNHESDSRVVVIQGVNHRGEPLRPSDWAERLCANLASFGQDHRLRYDLAVQPCILSGEKCLMVARGLAESNPPAYEFLMAFARSNDLKVYEDRRHDERALQVITSGPAGPQS
jgi:hypothetical protein